MYNFIWYRYFVCENFIYSILSRIRQSKKFRIRPDPEPQQLQQLSQLRF